MIAERLFVDAVDSSKVVHRLEEYLEGDIVGYRVRDESRSSYRGLYHFSQMTTGSFNNCAEVLECLFCLFIDAAGHDLPGRRIKRDVPRDEQKIPEFYGLRIWANRTWGVYHRICRARSRKGTGSPEVKTGVKAGSVVTMEDIFLSKGGLSVRTWIGIGWR